MIVNYLLVLIVLVLFGGLVLDAGLLELNKTVMQSAVDAAAQEAVLQLARSDSNWLTQALAQATSNGYTNGVNGASVSIINPPTSGTYAGNTQAVQATISQPVKNTIMALLNNASTTVSVSATAQIMPTCIWILNPTSNSGGSLWLASARMNANCGVSENTTSGYTLAVDGFSTLNSTRIRVYGPSTNSLSTGTISKQPKYNSAKKHDPLAYLTAPTLLSCTHSNIAYTNATVTLNPGSYCGGLNFTYSTITLNPGLYIIDGGLSAYNTNIYGTSGVTLYFTKVSTSSTYSPVTISSDNYASYGLYLKAPTSSSGGGIPAVAMFTDRNWINHGGQGIQLQNVTVQCDGFWYFPNTGLYTWGVPFTYYKYNGLVVDNIYQYGGYGWISSNFASDYSDFGGVSPLHYEDGVLVQ